MTIRPATQDAGMAKIRKFYFSGVETEEDVEELTDMLTTALGLSKKAIKIKRSSTKAIVKIDPGSRDIDAKLPDTLYVLRRNGFMGQEF